MSGTGILALQAAAFLPVPLSPQGQHQPEGGTRQPPFTPRLRGSGSLCSPSPWTAQPRGRSYAERQRQSWTPSRGGTALKRCSTPPRASVNITLEQCRRDTGVLGQAQLGPGPLWL